MRHLALAAFAVVGLAACTSGQVTTAASVVAEGQLVCAVGPTLVKMVDVNGTSILAKGASSTYVQAVCAAIDGIAVSPPTANAPLPSVTVNVAIPLKS